ncbi:MAG: polysaccharide deacetylase family protein [Oscillospiraceae bacterium]|nr:polysaccharide deacetylase family protein [Oscillospiraceae bacterium]
MKRKNWIFIICISALILLIVGFSLMCMEGRRDREPIVVEPGAEKLVALTFDDGPHPLYTLRVLDVLYEHQAPSTFFISGKNILNNRGLIEQMVSDGHELGNHTYHHYDLTTLTKDEIRLEIQRTQEALEQVLPDYSMLYMRPPFGRYNHQVLMASHLPMILWDIDSYDWAISDVDIIFSVIMDNVQDGSIIVFHDDNIATVKALERILPELRQRGFQPVTLTQLFESEN